MHDIIKFSSYRELKKYSRYALKIGIAIKGFFTKPIITVTSLPILIAPNFTTTQKALMLLLAFYVLDFITGIMASYVNFKKEVKETPSDPNCKRYLISSTKLRLSLVKAVVYITFIFCFYGIEKIFFIKDFSSSISTEKLTLTTVSIAIACFIEFYSIFFENFKVMGVDLIQKVKKIFATGWELYDSAKNSKK